MREDMAKVIVERPRRGGRGLPRQRRSARCAMDELPYSEGMSVGGTKSLNEYLAPLRRYIQAQEGRPWNKVYGEIRDRITAGNTIQEHILTHLYDFILLGVEKREPSQAAPCGLVRGDSVRWRAMHAPVDVGQLYVDPDDGIIKRARRKLKGPVAKKPEPSELRLTPYLHAGKVNGIWYGVELADYVISQRPRPPELQGRPETWQGAARRYVYIVGDQVFDDLYDPLPATAHRSGRGHMGMRYGPGKYPMRKRQLSARELKRYGLSND